MSEGKEVRAEEGNAMPQPAQGRPGGASPPAGSAAPDHRWLILGVIALAQLMIVLDATVMNIALPTAQRELGFTIVDRQWVVTAYALAFGSLLLLGGKLADLLGRKVTFVAGLIGFAVASAAGGAAVNFAMLVAARACQGAFGALLAPSALSLLARLSWGGLPAPGRGLSSVRPDACHLIGRHTVPGSAVSVLRSWHAFPPLAFFPLCTDERSASQATPPANFSILASAVRRY